MPNYVRVFILPILLVLFVLVYKWGSVEPITTGNTQENVLAIAHQLHAIGDITTQTADQSTDSGAWNLRKEIASLLQQGDSNAEVIQIVTAKYGSAILATPSLNGGSLLSWVPPILLFLLVFIIGIYLFEKNLSKDPEQQIQISSRTNSFSTDEEIKHYI